MNCPECGRFMSLVSFDDVQRDVDESAYWWTCTNVECDNCGNGKEIPSPPHDWLYWYKYLPKEDLDEFDLRDEYNRAKEAYLSRRKKGTSDA